MAFWMFFDILRFEAKPFPEPKRNHTKNNGRANDARSHFINGAINTTSYNDCRTFFYGFFGQFNGMFYRWNFLRIKHIILAKMPFKELNINFITTGFRYWVYHKMYVYQYYSFILRPSFLYR